jgi:hypothetical protein
MKKQKNGFSIQLQTKDSNNNYTVYFQNKNNKVIQCFLHDFYQDKVFRGKAVLHEGDIFSEKDGMKLAFDRSIKKRNDFYDKKIKEKVNILTIDKEHETGIVKKFNKFIEGR